jgi:hypothetical protein
MSLREKVTIPRLLSSDQRRMPSYSRWSTRSTELRCSSRLTRTVSPNHWCSLGMPVYVLAGKPGMGFLPCRRSWNALAQTGNTSTDPSYFCLSCSAKRASFFWRFVKSVRIRLLMYSFRIQTQRCFLRLSSLVKMRSSCAASSERFFLAVRCLMRSFLSCSRLAFSFRTLSLDLLTGKPS